MRKNKLLLLLALLLTAATGAWATDVYVVGNGTGNWLNDAVWDPGVAGNKMTEQNGVYSITFTNVAANSELQFKFSINGTWDENYGCSSDDENELNKTLSNIELFGTNIMFGLTEPADVTISFNLSEMTYMISTKGMKVGDDAASGPKHLITATYREQTRSLEQPLPYATTIGELFEAVSGGQSLSYLISGMSDLGMPLTGISSNNTSVVSIGEFNGASTPVTVIADGKATIGIDFSGYVDGIFVSAISPLYAYMKDGVKDADKWTVKVGEGQAQALPIGGLKGDGSETVTLQYNGRLKVKGVKATSDEKPAAPASTPLDNTTTAWTAGTYAVPAGGLTYSDAITVSGDVTLTLTDGTTLTLNKGISLASGATLTIQGNGTMNVNGTDGNTSSTVGGNHGTLVLTSGTLTARGGNGGSVEPFEYDVHGGNGGDAINGSVIVNGGTLTARGGNGGSVGETSDECSGGNGGDAISGTLTINGGSTSVNDGSNGSIGNNCEDSTVGRGGKGHN